MLRVSEVVEVAQAIVGSPRGRHELVALASALTHIYLACMAKLLETPQDEAFGRTPEELDTRLLSMPQVADRLGIPTYSARELGRRGELPTVHIGSRVLVSQAALKQFIRARETNGNGLHPRETRQVDTRLPRRVR